MYKIACLLSLVIFSTSLVGCSVPIREVDKMVKKSDIPPVGEVNTAELGAKLLQQQDVEVVRGRKVAQVVRGSLGIFPADYQGMYMRANNGEHYCGNVTNRDPLNNGTKRFVCFTDQEFRALNLPYAEVEDIVQRPANLQRVLEYSGKSANTISVFYKEFNETTDGAFIRPAFTQEFKFDLNDSNVIGIKGARIEVIKANNTGITYKVISHFPR